MLKEVERIVTTRVSRLLTLEDIEKILIEYWPKDSMATCTLDWDDCGEGGVRGATITYETVERVVE